MRASRVGICASGVSMCPSASHFCKSGVPMYPSAFEMRAPQFIFWTSVFHFRTIVLEMVKNPGPARAPRVDFGALGKLLVLR